MKAIKKRISILSLVFMLVSLFVAPTSALASTATTDQKVVLYYPNGDWGLTPVEKNLSVNKKDNIYLLALQQLAHPDTLPVGVYDEFPESFNVEKVRIGKKTAYVTISATAFEDPKLSDSWLNTLGDIISYNLFYMNKEISSVEFMSSAPAKRAIDIVKKNDLFSTPSVSPEKSKKVLKVDLDYKSLAKMSKEERDKTVQDAINKALGNSEGTLSILVDDYTVAIDPGHGGYDPGAVVSGVYEKNLNLNIALAMRDYLEGISYPYPTFNVVMTRSTDVFVSLTDRHNIANNANADVFISIHNNSTANTSVRGTTARYPNNHDVSLSIDLANELIDVLTPDPLPKHSDASYQDIQVLRNTTMPATLVEVGFMTNSSDLYILQTEYDDIGYYLGLATNVWCQVNL